MKKRNLASNGIIMTALWFVLIPYAGTAQRAVNSRQHIPIDSIYLSDPFILADAPTGMYYMTGTGGLLWKSKDLQYWDGPYRVAYPDTSSWMGKDPMIWAAEIHAYKGKYYYFATFTNQEKRIGTYQGRTIQRRASHILVSEKPEGPYLPMRDSVYLPGNLSTLDATFWIDRQQRPWMIYCHEWIQNNNGTVEKIQLKPDLSGVTGKAKILFRASDSPWSREKINGKIQPNRVTDGPYVFRTKTGRLGMIWTSWVYDVYTQGVAYSKSGRLDGPWEQEPAPVTAPGFGHGMIFKDLKGQSLMAVHSHKKVNGQTVRKPHLFVVNLQGDKLSVERSYDPGLTSIVN